MNDRSRVVTAIGVLYVLLGVGLLLVTLGLFTVPWEVVGPLLVMGAGVVVMAGGVARLRHGRRAG